MADNRGHELLGVNIFFIVVATCVVALRCYTRGFISKAFGLDDCLMALACTFFLGYVICSNMGVQYGTGQHRDDLAPENYAMAKRYWWICYIFFGLTMMTAKLSFGWLLLRIVCVPEHIWVIYGTSLVVIVIGIIFFFITIFQCQPIAHYWNDTVPGECLPIHIYVSLAYTYSAISVTTDLIFALLPAFIIWHLQIRTRIRWILIFLMGLGCVASSAVLVRIAYLSSFYDPDFLWATTDVAIWSTIEMGLAITAASCSTLRPLARSLGFNVGLTYYGSAGSDGCNNLELRGPSQPANRRPSELGVPRFNVSGTSQDTLNVPTVRDPSVSSQATVNYALNFEHKRWPSNQENDIEHGEGCIEQCPVDRTGGQSISRDDAEQSGVVHSAREFVP